MPKELTREEIQDYMLGVALLIEIVLATLWVAVGVRVIIWLYYL